MTAPTIGTSALDHFVSPSAGPDETRTFTVSPSGAEGLVVMVTCRTNGAGNPYTATPPTYGGVAVPLAADSGNVGNGQRAAIFFLDDLSSVSGSTLTVQVNASAAMYDVWYGLVQHSGDVQLLDAGDDPGDGPVALDSGPTDGRVYACGAGGSEITPAGGLSSLWDEDFIGPYHSEGAHKTLTGSGSAELTSALAMAAIVVGGTDVLLSTATRLGAEWAIRAATLEVPTDISFTPTTRLGAVWALRPGAYLMAEGERRPVLGGYPPELLTLAPAGSVEGDVWTWHVGRVPTFDTPTGGSGSIAVAETDGTPEVDPATRLELDPGLIVTAPGGGVARVTPDWAEDADLSTAAFGDSPAAGTSPEIPRADHKHGMPASPAADFGEDADIVQIDYGDAAAAGATGEVADAAHQHAVNAKFQEASLVFEFGPGAAVNDYHLIPIPWAFTPQSWTIIGNVSGTCTIDLWMDTYANGQPTNADSITASATPAVAGPAISAQSSSLTGWDTTWAKGDLLKVVIEALATMTQLTIEIQGIKT